MAEITAIGEHGVGRAAAGGKVGEEVARNRHNNASLIQDFDPAMTTTGDLRTPYHGHGAISVRTALCSQTTTAAAVKAQPVHIKSEHLFGICALLGIAFVPRLKDLSDQVLSRIDRETDYGVLQPLLRGASTST